MPNPQPPSNQDNPHVALAQQQLQLSGQRIDCRLECGTLILRGRVASFHQKQLVQTVALRLPGVERIVNELDVHPEMRSGQKNDSSASAT